MEDFCGVVITVTMGFAIIFGTYKCVNAPSTAELIYADCVADGGKRLDCRKEALKIQQHTPCTGCRTSD
jgi:hypothetical protein